MTEYNILICGVGGQGTVLASKIIAAAAMECGYTVHSAETIGMAQRGGPVTSHVRIGDEAYSPLIAKGGADIVLAFEPGEGIRDLPYLKDGGMMLVSEKSVMPVTEALMPSGYVGGEAVKYLSGLRNVHIARTAAVEERFGSMKFLNITMLGALSASGALPIDREVLLSVMKRSVPEKFLKVNTEAFELGETLYSE